MRHRQGNPHPTSTAFLPAGPQKTAIRLRDVDKGGIVRARGWGTIVPARPNPDVMREWKIRDWLTGPDGERVRALVVDLTDKREIYVPADRECWPALP